MGRKDSKYQIEGVGQGRALKKMNVLAVLFILALIIGAIVPFTSIGKKAIRKVGWFLVGDEARASSSKGKVKEKIVEVPIEVKIPSAPASNRNSDSRPSSHSVTGKPIENISDYSNSSKIQLKSEILFEESDSIASVDRVDKSSYQMEYSLTVKLPKPAKTVEEVLATDASLTSIFPGLAKMIENAEVSPYFYEIYKNKSDRVKRNGLKMNELLTRHNFFDLQTILNMKATSGRRVMIMQSDMDVVSDGSDGDRLSTMPEKIVNSTHYQPSTSYFWKKQTETPNPMIAGFEARVRNANAEIADPNTTAARKKWLTDRLKVLKTKIEDMKWHSYLIAEYDPFIVIPISMLTNMGDKYAPKVGDYALVIHNEKIYPCIVGDGGPTFKVGEASLRLAKQINKDAGIYSRPVSELSVTYLVFPNSRESKKSPPDYSIWREKCEELIGQIGGMSPDYQLERWINTLPSQN